MSRRIIRLVLVAVLSAVPMATATVLPVATPAAADGPLGPPFCCR